VRKLSYSEFKVTHNQKQTRVKAMRKD